MYLDFLRWTQLEDADFADGSVLLLDMMLKGGMIKSKGEGRRLIQQGGVTADGEKVTDMNLTFDRAALADGLVVKKGKKVFHKFYL